METPQAGNQQGAQTDDASASGAASSGDAGTPANQGEGNQGEGAGRVFDQSYVTRIAAREKREGASARETKILEQTGFTSLDELNEAISEYRTIQEAADTETDRLERRATSLDKRATKAERERDEARSQVANVRREYALRDWLRDNGIVKGRADLALRVADLDNIEVDPETGEVSGVEVAGKAIKKASPEWFTDTQQTPPDLSTRPTVNDNTQPGYQRLLSAFTPGRGG